MSGERLTIGGVTTAWSTHSLCNIKDYAREAILVKVDFLIIWDLTDSAKSGLAKYKIKGLLPASPDISK